MSQLNGGGVVMCTSGFIDDVMFRHMTRNRRRETAYYSNADTWAYRHVEHFAFLSGEWEGVQSYKQAIYRSDTIIQCNTIICDPRMVSRI